jgi:predicted Zn-dependent protease
MQAHHVLFIFLILLLLFCGCITDTNVTAPDTESGTPDTLATLQSLLESDPENPDLWYAMAEILKEQGDNEGAIHAITRAANSALETALSCLQKRTST